MTAELRDLLGARLGGGPHPMTARGTGGAVLDSTTRPRRWGRQEEGLQGAPSAALPWSLPGLGARVAVLLPA